MGQEKHWKTEVLYLKTPMLAGACCRDINSRLGSDGFCGAVATNVFIRESGTTAVIWKHRLMSEQEVNDIRNKWESLMDD